MASRQSYAAIHRHRESISLGSGVGIGQSTSTRRSQIEGSSTGTSPAQIPRNVDMAKRASGARPSTSSSADVQRRPSAQRRSLSGNVTLPNQDVAPFADPSRDAAPLDIDQPKRSQQPNEADLVEFLEGLLEGFRSAGSGQNRETSSDQSHAQVANIASWSDLDELSKVHHLARSVPQLNIRNFGHSPPTSPKTASTPQGSGYDMQTTSIRKEAPSSLPSLMRRHALRSFLEETCGTVANSFDVMAGLALQASLGGSGTPQDRLLFMFREEEFRITLMGLGYGVGARPDWWHDLFVSLDVDGDGSVSIQDMYDALVLALPSKPSLPMGEEHEVFFTSPPQDTWRRKSLLQTQKSAAPS
eukprot:TRINITY_DN117570_c0_g1_i1.p1 TRINITY_DN117570_c0_g1~~TRINITY_DN117570_c0_g1_i1.p1  ORF type:complete len:358 (-),score=40.79 TRINITY_DN117570_c0_g1_i1:85-1158(-)